MYDPNYKVTSLYSYLERNKTLYGDKAVFKFNKKDEVVEVSYYCCYCCCYYSSAYFVEPVALEVVPVVADCLSLPLQTQCFLQ